MKLNVKISNFGKIESADLQIRPFTVIAGKNASGKSFVTKALYSFFSTLSKDFVTVEVLALIQSIGIDLRAIYLTRTSADENIALQNAMESCKRLVEIAHHEYGQNTINGQIERAHVLIAALSKVSFHLDEFIGIASKKNKFKKLSEKIGAAQFHIKQLENIIQKPTSVIVNKIQNEFTESLKENFQISSLASLKRFSAGPLENPEFVIDQIGTISTSGERVNFNLNTNGIGKIQEFSNIVYLESPIYWRLKDALTRSHEQTMFSFFHKTKRQELLSGVPKYFFDLLSLLKERVKISQDSDALRVIKNEINSSIGGELVITSNGDINYRDEQSSKDLSLQTTATGIVNLGLIGLLLERNVITKGSFIIIDEPEVNLHPAWQKVMVDCLYELSKNGINIIIATHSIDMLKSIEMIVKRMPREEAAEHFGINRLTTDGNSITEGMYPLKKIASIKNDLGETFYSMQLEGFSNGI